MARSTWKYAVIAPFALFAATDNVLGQEEKPEEIIAVQLRSQGFACDNPRNALRDPADTRPDEAAWTIECDGQKYRVRFVPDMAAQVEKID
jgi:hypothetical protein